MFRNRSDLVIIPANCYTSYYVKAKRDIQMDLRELNYVIVCDDEVDLDIQAQAGAHRSGTR